MLDEKNQQIGEFSTNNFKIHKSANTELQIDPCLFVAEAHLLLLFNTHIIIVSWS